MFGLAAANTELDTEHASKTKNARIMIDLSADEAQTVNVHFPAWRQPVNQSVSGPIEFGPHGKRLPSAILYGDVVW